MVQKRDAPPEPAFQPGFLFSGPRREISHPPPLLSPQNAPHIALGPHLRPPFLGVPSALCQTPGECRRCRLSARGWEWVGLGCGSSPARPFGELPPSEQGVNAGLNNPASFCPPCPQVTGSCSRHKQRCLHGSKRCSESKTWRGEERGGRALPFFSLLADRAVLGAGLGEPCTSSRETSSRSQWI